VVEKPNRFTVQIDRDKHTDVGKLAALNHSCDPNVILDTANLLVYARKDIEKGEELSFFYPATEWEMDAPFICLCGASNCIHVVAGRALPAAFHARASLPEQAHPRVDDRTVEQHRIASEEFGVGGEIATKMTSEGPMHRLFGSFLFHTTQIRRGKEVMTGKVQ
jgi:hypothetical protein